MPDSDGPAKVTVPHVMAARREGRRITMVTAYDYSFAAVVDKSDIDIILVGDSGGMTLLGHQNTLPVTMDEMLLMSRAVARGCRHCLLVGDMPFGSYEAGPQPAVANAMRFLKEAAMDAVKLEGGVRMAATVRAIADANIPVMGHIGLTPQSIAKLGSFQVQGRSAAAAAALMEDALALEEAGVFSLVLEAIPAEVAAMITERVTVPTIGIGAGPGCDGQVLVLHDLLGLFQRFVPKFVKRYADLATEARRALDAYAAEVRSGEFPDREHSYHLPAGEERRVRARLEEAGPTG